MPAMTAKVQMIVLWTDEIRIAAQALKRLNDMPEDSPQPEFGDAVWAAVSACTVALQGADEDGATLLLSTKPDHLLSADAPGEKPL